MRRAEVIGNLGSDGELKTTAGGTTVMNFSVAANGSRKDDDTIWVRCAMFGTRAEKLCEYMKKGTKVFARGEFKMREFEGKNGKQTSFEMSVDELELLGSKEKADGNW